MAPRLTYRRRHSYHNKSNAVRIVKTPGARCLAAACPILLSSRRMPGQELGDK